jgi:carboxylate-amine ligase
VTSQPAWARWSPVAASMPWTVGIEEEVMLLDPATRALEPRIDDVLATLSPELVGHVAAETHGSAVELNTAPHPTPAAAAFELGELRAALARDLNRNGMHAAASGTHPFAQWEETEISPSARSRSILDSMRELARREPTYALHVHVAVPTPTMAVRAMDGLRAHLPLLLALSANSPYWQGRDSGLASARTPVFGAFPRTGIPRRFGTYAEYVDGIDVLIRCGAIPEPTFLWWDARLQPRFGTLEIRIMDAQSRLEDVAALVALAQCAVRLEATSAELALQGAAARPEVLNENRFLALRDGMAAEFVDPGDNALKPAPALLDELLDACAPHAAALGCEAELDGARALAGDAGATRQRVLAGDHCREDLPGLVGALVDEFLLPVRVP